MREGRRDALHGVNRNLVARPRVVRISGPVCGESASRPRSAHERCGTRRHDPDTRLRVMSKAAWSRNRTVNDQAGYGRGCAKTASRISESSDDGAANLGDFTRILIASRSPQSAIVRFGGRMRPRAPARETKFEPGRLKRSLLASVCRCPRCASRASGYRPGRADSSRCARAPASWSGSGSTPSST